MLDETEHMVQSTRSMFYALAVHGKMKNEGIDTVAMVFALTVHSLIDYQMDRITAGKAEQFGGGYPYSKELISPIRGGSAPLCSDICAVFIRTKPLQ